MMIIMKPNATPQQVEAVIASVKSAGLDRPPVAGSGSDHDRRDRRDAQYSNRDASKCWMASKLVQAYHAAYKLASRQFHPENSILPVDGFTVGGEGDRRHRRTVLGGEPLADHRNGHGCEGGGCVALCAAACSSRVPRRIPSRDWARKGWSMLAEAREKTGLPIVVEIMSQVQLDVMVKYVDVLQVGARNMQNFNLLRAIGETRTSVLLKRGLSATIEELLMSAEYILAGGNQRVMLCERGIRTFETATRNTTDINAIPVLKNLTHLPVILDPSHATGHADYVAAIARAGIAAGADGLIVEVHPDPAHAVSDGKQSLKPEAFAAMVKQVGQIAQVMGRSLASVNGTYQSVRQGWA